MQNLVAALNRETGRVRGPGGDREDRQGTGCAAAGSSGGRRGDAGVDLAREVVGGDGVRGGQLRARPAGRRLREGPERLG